MTRFVSGNLFLLTSMVCAATSQLLLKDSLQGIDPPGLTLASWRPLLETQRLARGGTAGLLIGIGFVCWVLCLARLPLAYAYPIACSSIVFVALLGVLFLGETVTPRMLAGTLLITLGVLLLTPRP